MGWNHQLDGFIVQFDAKNKLEIDKLLFDSLDGQRCVLHLACARLYLHMLMFVS